MNWFRLHDTNPGSGAIEMPPGEADAWNKRGWGIFWTVNTFDGPRKIENLTRVEAWAIDIDEGSKKDQEKRIEKGLTPSRIVETKRGYQVYWRAKDGTPQNWNAIVSERLVPFYGADKNAKDLARILRVPGYMHLKDPKDPFLIREVYRCHVSYSEAQMLAFYKTKKKRSFPVSDRAIAVTEELQERIRRAEKYLAKIPPAISGQAGHDQTFRAALLTVRGFALPEHEAFRLLADYNARCIPQWSEKELIHKIKSASGARVPEGFKLIRGGRQ